MTNLTTATTATTATNANGIPKFKYTYKQANAQIEKIGKAQSVLAKDIRELAEDLILRFKIAGDLSNPATGGLGDVTLLNELQTTLYNTRGAWERVGVWFIKHTGGALRFNKDDKFLIEKVKGKPFIVGDIDTLPHPLDKLEKGEPTKEQTARKEKSRLQYDKRVLSLLEKMHALALEYQNDLAGMDDDRTNKPVIDDSILAKLELITGVKLETVAQKLAKAKAQ